MSKQTLHIVSTNPLRLLEALNNGNTLDFTTTLWANDIPEDWYHLTDIELDTSIIDREQLTRMALETLDAEEIRLRVELEGKLHKLEERRQSLLALPHLTEAVDGSV